MNLQYRLKLDTNITNYLTWQVIVNSDLLLVSYRHVWSLSVEF